MNILWFTWKDKKHPQAGGAEAVNEDLAKQLVKDGHKVILLVGGYKECKKKEVVDGYTVIRLGNKFTVYVAAYFYYKNYLSKWTEIILEEINTVPFMTQWYTKGKRFLVIYQLCREIWFHQIFFPLSIIGFIAEPIYLWLLRKNTVLTESLSTKKDLQNYGFNEKNIAVFQVAIDTKNRSNSSKKYSTFTLLSFGALRSMKRTIDQIKAFEHVKKDIPLLKLKIAGESHDAYGEKVMKLIDKSQYKNDIEYLGRVSSKVRRELMEKSHLILVTSLKEGWGLIVTEANLHGTPAVVYNVDGLRDSVVHGKTGLICSSNTPENLAETITKIYKNKTLYTKLQKNAKLWALQFTPKKSYSSFVKFINIKKIIKK